MEFTSKGRRACIAGAGLLALGAVGPWARAQAGYPKGPVKIVVPFAPGGNVDVMARFIAPRLSERLGQPVIVENRAGAGGNIATEYAARAEADGQTLLLNSANLVINAELYKLNFDTFKDLAPVTQVVVAHFVLLVNPALPARTLSELIALAKAQPGRLSFASWGGGSGGHVTLELLKQAAGVDILHVPYKGVAPAMQATIGGEVNMMVDVLGTALPQIRAGKVVPIAVASGRRAAQLPEVPLFSETLPGFLSEGWQGFFVPARTPRTTVDRLQQEIKQILQVPDIHKRLVEMGFEVVGSTPGQFATRIAEEHTIASRIVKSANIKAD